MNIATGGGTLVHELVHPFIAASFPAVPAWFNEGLASLYEAVREEHGQMWGLPNWRLAGLQRAIRAGKLPSFAMMTGDSDARFYASSTGYAQARYLCLYLQEKGLLHRYYDGSRPGSPAIRPATRRWWGCSESPTCRASRSDGTTGCWPWKRTDAPAP